MAELKVRTRLPVRKLRYVVDHRLVPDLPDESPGHGVPRTFTELLAFGIALAATLLTGGATRKLVAACMGVVCRPAPEGSGGAEAPLLSAFVAGAGELSVADARFVRVRTPGGAAADRTDTGWLPLASRDATVAPPSPTVLITADLADLANSVRPRRTARR